MKVTESYPLTYGSMHNKYYKVVNGIRVVNRVEKREPIFLLCEIFFDEYEGVSVDEFIL